MGLLDGLFSGNANQQGLLAGSMALLNASGPSRMPVGLGQALARGFGAGQEAYQGAQEAEMQRQYREAQIQKMKTDADAKARQDAMLQGLLSGGNATNPEVLEKAGTAMLFGGDPRGSGVIELAKQRRALLEKQSEMDNLRATDTRAGAAERFMGPELAVIPGLHQRAMAAGNFIQQNPGADPKTARAMLDDLDKMVTTYNSQKQSQADKDSAAWQAEQGRNERARESLELRRTIADKPKDDKPKTQYDPIRGVVVNLEDGKSTPVKDTSTGKELGYRDPGAGIALSAKEIQAREAAYPKATVSLKTFEAGADEMIRDIKKLKDHPGLSGMTGLIFGRTPNLTGAAREAQALYQKIIARGGFTELTNMRMASPTGAALGSVSNQEGQYLREAFAALAQTQDTASVKNVLTDIEEKLKSAKPRVREAYDMTYEYRGGAKTTDGVDKNNPLLK